MRARNSLGASGQGLAAPWPKPGSRAGQGLWGAGGTAPGPGFGHRYGDWDGLRPGWDVSPQVESGPRSRPWPGTGTVSPVRSGPWPWLPHSPAGSLCPLPQGMGLLSAVPSLHVSRALPAKPLGRMHSGPAQTLPHHPVSHPNLCKS